MFAPQQPAGEKDLPLDGGNSSSSNCEPVGLAYDARGKVAVPDEENTDSVGSEAVPNSQILQKDMFSSKQDDSASLVDLHCLQSGIDELDCLHVKLSGMFFKVAFCSSQAQHLFVVV